MVLPSPTPHFDPSQIVSLAANKLLHTYDGLLPNSASIKKQFGKYLDLYTQKNIEWVLWKSLHACFANRAKLKAWISLKPIPPLPSGLQSFFQLIQWIFFSSFVWPYQYLASVEFSVSHKAFGILKIPIVYVGMTWATILISISLPTFEIKFSFQPITFFVILSCRPLNIFTFDFPPTIEWN